MKRAAVQLDPRQAAVPGAHAGAPQLQYQQLRQRLRELGLLTVTCSVEGELCARPVPGSDWLADLLCESAVFQAAMRDATAQWNRIAGSSTLPLLEPIAGCVLVAMSIAERRKRTGYAVTILLSERALSSEGLAAMNHGASAPALQAGSDGAHETRLRDLRQMLEHLPPVGENQIGRVASMVRLLHADHVRLASDSAAMESIGQQLAESYEELNLLYTIIGSMTVVERPDRFVRMACEELLATLPFAWVGVQFCDDARSNTSGLHHQRLGGQLIVAGKLPQVGPANPVDSTASEASLQEQASSANASSSPRRSDSPSWAGFESIRSAARTLLRSARVNEPMVLEPARRADHGEFAPFGVTAAVQPIIGRSAASSAVNADGNASSVIGLLIAGNRQGDDPAISSADMKVLNATATHMSIFLENSALYDDLSAMFLGTLEALTASIDAKDRYTCGHSMRVAALSHQLAVALELDERIVERVHIAGLVHDVGKIGVPESVLCKPGRLTDEEFAWIKQHPEIGYRILKDIPQLRDVLPGVLHHHERWDGRGYPHGLRGLAIPQFARVIALADSFDAMSSNRHYRAALSREQVLAEIGRCSGTQFDPELAAVFLRLDFSEYDRLAQHHSAKNVIGELRATEIDASEQRASKSIHADNESQRSSSDLLRTVIDRKHGRAA